MMIFFTSIIKKGLGLSVLLVFYSFVLLAQDTKNGNWLISVGSLKLNSKWNIHHEVQYRNYNAIGNLEQLLLRGGLGYQLTPSTNVLLGYAYVITEPYKGLEKQPKNFEHRIFQQVLVKNTTGRFYLTHRFRLEQRLLEADYRNRFRYFIGLNLPINQPTLKEKTFYLSAYSELFIHLNAPVFDRNRLYTALGYQPINNLKFELGYMSQVLPLTYRNQFQLGVFYSL